MAKAKGIIAEVGEEISKSLSKSIKATQKSLSKALIRLAKKRKIPVEKIQKISSKIFDELAAAQKRWFEFIGKELKTGLAAVKGIVKETRRVEKKKKKK